MPPKCLYYSGESKVIIGFSGLVLSMETMYFSSAYRFSYSVGAITIYSPGCQSTASINYIVLDPASEVFSSCDHVGFLGTPCISIIPLYRARHLLPKIGISGEVRLECIVIVKREV